MSALIASLAAAASDLRAMHRRFALIGGLAVSLRAEPRFTRDADLMVAVSDDADAERVVHEMVRRGYDVLASIEHLASGRLATVRLTSRLSGGIVVDLLFSSSGIENEVVAGAELLEVAPNLQLPVATVGHLIALKLLSHDEPRRRQDLVDLDNLADVATEADWATATAACGAIVDRGFARQRDLVALCESWRRGERVSASD